MVKFANKYRYYEQEVRRLKDATNDVNTVTYLTPDNTDKTHEGEVLDKLKLIKYAVEDIC